jgi:hypothetical protein
MVHTELMAYLMRQGLIVENRSEERKVAHNGNTFRLGGRLAGRRTNGYATSRSACACRAQYVPDVTIGVADNSVEDALIFVEHGRMVTVDIARIVRTVEDGIGP